MSEDINSVSILVRREIEALITVPLIKAFSEELGRDKAVEAARNVIRNLAHEAGKALAAFVGGNKMEDLVKGMSLFSQGGALEMEILESGPTRMSMNVTRCQYAEMYKKQGMEEYGLLLSCGRDFALIEGFNPKINLTRTKTIMEGADYCDFRYTMKDSINSQ